MCHVFPFVSRSARAKSCDCIVVCKKNREDSGRTGDKNCCVLIYTLDRGLQDQNQKAWSTIEVSVMN